MEKRAKLLKRIKRKNPALFGKIKDTVKSAGICKAANLLHEAAIKDLMRAMESYKAAEEGEEEDEID
jgi:hypothetical protein